MSFLLLGMLPIMAISMYALMKLCIKHSNAISEAYSEAVSVTYTTVSNIRTILSLDMAEYMISKFCNGSKKACTVASKRMGWIGLASGCINSTQFLSYLLLTLFGSSLLYKSIRATGCDPSGAYNSNQCPQSGSDVFGAMMAVILGGLYLGQAKASFEGKR